MKKEKKEDIELAKQHIELAENIIVEQAKNADKKTKEKLTDAEFSLEKAESNLD